MLSEEITSCTMGTLEGLVRTTSGGVMPGGMRRMIAWEMATACDMAVAMLA